MNSSAQEIFQRLSVSVTSINASGFLCC